MRWESNNFRAELALEAVDIGLAFSVQLAPTC